MAVIPTGNNSGGTNAGGAPANGGIIPKVVKTAVNLLTHGGDVFHGVNDRIGKNSQTTPQNRPGNSQQNTGDRPHGTQGPQKQHGTQGPQNTGNNSPTNKPQSQNPNPTAKTNGTTPPLQTPTAPGKQTPLPPPTNGGQTVNTPPIIANPGNQNQTPHQNFPQWNPPIIIVTTRRNDEDSPQDNSPHGNRPTNNYSNGQIRNAVIEILRQSDIFISRSAVNDLIGNQNTNGNQNGSNRSANIPTEVRQLVQSIVSELTNLTNSNSTLNNTTSTNPQIIRQTGTEISNNLQQQINAAREILIFTSQPDAKNFGNLNIQERVFLAVELMFNHLPSETSLQQLPNKEIYNGLLLARGMISPGENTADIRNLISLRSDVLPNGFSPSELRDLGQLVKVLVAGAVDAKTTVNLDAAVQKFIKILVANNELGILLAASMLAKQAEIGSLSMNRTLALVQIYQLITRLILAGDAALKEAAAKTALSKNENNSAAKVLDKITDAKEKTAALRDLQNNNLHVNLKNFLEFNPAFVAERSASSFVNPDDARHAQQHFTSHHTDEIQQWLDGGNHRFVKEIDLDKPIGIVVERGAEDFFSASKARIVLVRDSSEQGWHFLKSFLVT